MGMGAMPMMGTMNPMVLCSAGTHLLYSCNFPLCATLQGHDEYGSYDEHGNGECGGRGGEGSPATSRANRPQSEGNLPTLWYRRQDLREAKQGLFLKDTPCCFGIQFFNSLVGSMLDLCKSNSYLNPDQMLSICASLQTTIIPCWIKITYIIKVGSCTCSQFVRARGYNTPSVWADFSPSWEVFMFVLSAVLYLRLVLYKLQANVWL